jgi:TetR/AcrR family transcriptional regulator, transcriptional repressor for nem operon
VARYTKDHKDKAHAAIVATAGTMLRERGFDGVGVKDVMAAAGLTHGGFYAHFASREAMLAEAMAEAVRGSPADFTQLCAAARAAGDGGIVAQYYLSDSRVADAARGCPAAALLGELGRQSGAVREAFAAGAAETVDALEHIAGSRPAAWAVLSVLAGALSLMRAAPDKAVREVIRQGAIEACRALVHCPKKTDGGVRSPNPQLASE